MNSLGIAEAYDDSFKQNREQMVEIICPFHSEISHANSLLHDFGNVKTLLLQHKLPLYLVKILLAYPVIYLLGNIWIKLDSSKVQKLIKSYLLQFSWQFSDSCATEAAGSEFESYLEWWKHFQLKSENLCQYILGDCYYHIAIAQSQTCVFCFNSEWR